LLTCSKKKAENDNEKGWSKFMSYLPQTKGDRALVTGALAVFFGALYWLWNYQPPSHGPGNAEKIAVVETSAPLRRRHAGTLAWSAIDQSGPIYFRDIVYTPAGVSAVVKLRNGKELPLPEDSLVQFDEVTVANIEIALRETAQKKDVFRLIPMPKTEQSRLLPDPLSLELLFEDLEGRMKTQMDQPRQQLTQVQPPRLEFELDSLADFQVRLLKPTDKGIYNLRRDNWFTMSWSAVPLGNVKYVLEIARNPEFRKKLPFTADTNRLQVQLQNPGAYYWRVRAILKDQVLTSEIRTFEMSLRGGSTEVEKRINLPKATIQGFTAEIASDSDFETILQTELTDSPNCQQRAPLRPGTYYCRIRQSGTGKKVKEYTLRVRPRRGLAGQNKR
jgi:hypothetical protein